MTVLRAFRYCPNCAAEISVANNRALCEHCGFQFYDNPRGCTVLLLQNENDEYLLVRRASEPSRNLLDMSGGFVIEGETLEAGARRELREELGIEVGELQFVGSYPDVYPEKDVTYDTIAAAFAGRVSTDLEFKLSEELLSYEFFKYADIPWKELAFPSLRNLLEDVGSGSASVKGE